jgi:hypothetical protein
LGKVFCGIDWAETHHDIAACGDIPPVQQEQAHYPQHTALAEVGQSTS